MGDAILDTDCDDISLDSTETAESANAVELSSAASYVIHDFEKRLIEELKQRPFLYDHTKSDFKDLKRKDEAWAQVSEATGKSVDKCQCRWKSLRDRYVRESRRIREGSGPKRHLWEMFKYLTFLDEFPRLQRRRYSDHSPDSTRNGRTIKRPSVFTVPNSLPEQITTSQINTIVNIPTTQPSPQISSFVNCLPSPSSQLPFRLPEKSSHFAHEKRTTSNTVHNNSNRILTTTVDMADGCVAFGMSVSATLRTLAHEQQELAKLRIQQVLYEVQIA